MCSVCVSVCVCVQWVLVCVCECVFRVCVGVFQSVGECVPMCHFTNMTQLHLEGM